MGPTATASRDLILIGGGHAHVQVIRRWMMDPVPGVALTVVLDRGEALYSGMVPGVAAGELETHECTIDVVPLSRRAGGTVVLSAATRIDPEAKCVEFADRPPLDYDVASIDVGSTVRGLDLPGVREHALATRPIGAFVAQLDARVSALRARLEQAGPSGRRPQVAVVGGGAAGFEIACTLHARLGDLAGRFAWSLIAGDAMPLPGSSSRLRRAARRALDARGIRFEAHREVAEVRDGSLLVRRKDSSDASLHLQEADLVVWATGGDALPVCTGSPLPLDERGFVRVDERLRVLGCDDLFAAGDCAAFEARSLPKAGVYAVRQGPILDSNLRALLSGEALVPYRPQQGFLALLNLGHGVALGGKAGLAFQSRAVWRLKNRIDRNFMQRFQTLDREGRPSESFPSPDSMEDDDDPMLCGGCATKLAATSLEGALARLPLAPPDESVVFGLAQPDDAAGLRTASGDLVLATIDGFRAFDGDAWLAGRIATQNALSDIYAKGGRPRHALAIVTVESSAATRVARTSRTESQLHQVLAGVRHELDAAGVSLVGGHSTVGAELFIGLSISGEMPDESAPLVSSGLRPGDRLVLTKPLGTGAVMAADMRGLATTAWRTAAVENMLRANAPAAELARQHDVSAATDVSGFGFLGHLGEMLTASGVDAVIDPARLPALPGALQLIASGIRSSLFESNLGARRFLTPTAAEAIEKHALPENDLLFDPQTSGGLLLAVSAADEEALVAALHAGGDSRACAVGVVRPGSGLAHMADVDGIA